MNRPPGPAPHILPINKDMLTGAAGLIRGGYLVSFPTETVYGLGANAMSDAAVAQVFAAKQRPTFNPLIVHVPDLVTARQYVAFNKIAEQLAAAFWPGPLTLVLPRLPDTDVSDLVSAGLPTLAIRVPASPTAQQFLSLCRRPVAAPSANRSGSLSPTMASHVAAEFPDMDLPILDGGPCVGGLESTVIGFQEDRPILLRAGCLAVEDIDKIIGFCVKDATTEGSKTAPASPGMLIRHYAPSTPLVINANSVNKSEAWLGFGPGAIPGLPKASKNLSSAGDVVEAAANLFRYLRELDSAGASAISVAPIPMIGLGRAINDRLHRGSTAKNP